MWPVMWLTPQKQQTHDAIVNMFPYLDLLTSCVSDKNIQHIFWLSHKYWHKNYNNHQLLLYRLYSWEFWIYSHSFKAIFLVYENSKKCMFIWRQRSLVTHASKIFPYNYYVCHLISKAVKNKENIALKYDLLFNLLTFCFVFYIYKVYNS
jgi:hypothetical protein